MNKPRLVVMCGLQCSGKSTQAKILADEYNAEVVSSDQLRIEHPEYTNESIFKLLYDRVNNLLRIERNVIIDATNTTVKMRKQIFNNLKNDCEKICYIMNTPYIECEKRLAERNEYGRSHFVPLDVLDKYYHSFEIPFYEEGWDEIIINNQPEFHKSKDTFKMYLDLAKGFNQNNKHHTQDLGQHMKTVGDSIRNLTDDNLLIKAAYYHDIGKLFTQTYKPGDPNAHYYGHANVGAYSMLCNCALYHEYYTIDDEFFEYMNKETLTLIFYINYHMHMFNITSDKSINKWKGIFGEEKFNNLKILNDCDKTREN